MYGIFDWSVVNKMYYIKLLFNHYNAFIDFVFLINEQIALGRDNAAYCLTKKKYCQNLFSLTIKQAVLMRLFRFFIFYMNIALFQSVMFLVF